MQTRVVPTKVHGVLDYATGPALVAAPTLLGLNGSRASALAPRLAGAAASVYAPLTDYELGARRLIPMRAHLALDALAGATVAAVPWVTGARRRGTRHWLPHALVGATEIGLALTTRVRPPDDRRRRLGRALAIGAVPVALAAGGLAAVRLRRRGSAEETVERFSA